MADNAKPAARRCDLDIVRILAIFLVLFTHTGERGPKLYQYTAPGALQFFYTTLDCLRTINNPLLFMVSGALLLGREEPIRVIWRKRVLRFVVVLVVFTYVQAVYGQLRQGNGLAGFNAWTVFLNMLSGPIRTSYWYLYSYISFLVMLPFLRKIARNLSLKEGVYLFLVAIVVMDGFRLVTRTLNIPKVNFTVFLSEMNTAYPLLGWLLVRDWDELRGKHRWLWPALGLCAVAGVCLAAHFTLVYHQLYDGWVEGYITLFYTLTAAFVFVTIRWLTDRLGLNGRPRLTAALKFLSGTMFGIYLLENLLKDVTDPVYLALRPHMPTLAACGIWLLATMLLGNVVVGLLKLIPGVKKYI